MGKPSKWSHDRDVHSKYYPTSYLYISLKIKTEGETERQREKIRQNGSALSIAWYEYTLFIRPSFLCFSSSLPKKKKEKNYFDSWFFFSFFLVFIYYYYYCVTRLLQNMFVKFIMFLSVYSSKRNWFPLALYHTQFIFFRFFLYHAWLI